MTNYDQQIETAIRAVLFDSSATYSWFGRRSQPLPVAIKRTLTPEMIRSHLLYRLQYQLYSNFYCKGGAMPVEQETASHNVMSNGSLVESLSAANSGGGFWDDGWEVYEIADSYLLVRKDGLILRAQPEDCLTLQKGPITVGMQLRLRHPKEFLGISPGFYVAMGNTQFPHESSQTLVRVYWNFTPDGAVNFLRRATLALNEADLPFNLKALDVPARYARGDAVVLYIPSKTFDNTFEVLKSIYPDICKYLREATPAFTKRLAAGIGLAEDPGQGESFGQHRCHLLADGIIRAYEQKKKSIADRLKVVTERFAEEGISLEHPFLNPGSKDIYHLQHPPRPQSKLLRFPVRGSRIKFGSDEFLLPANEIGHRLAQEAIWHEGHCNWIGAMADEQGGVNSRAGTILAALGPELYSGTSGVALFLAELFNVTGEAYARRTSLGAIRQALRYADSVPPSIRLGLYSGWLGMAFAAARIGAIFQEEELLDDALQLARRSLEHEDEHELDLLAGSAGGIAGLIILSDLLEDTSLLDSARMLGNELIQAADESDAGYSWKLLNSPYKHNLTGFSHGAAGIGYALLELFHAVGDSKYRRAAELAFQYEHHWFDAQEANWPDFRSEAGAGIGGNRRMSFAAYWCHGAPGIALSRLRAYGILGDQKYRAEAITALQTTQRAIESELKLGRGNFSLCHGLAGNAEALIYSNQLLGQLPSEDASVLALRVANYGIEFHANHNLCWPCGDGPGAPPGLLLGLAGIGYFYLRLYNSATPSILLLERESFAASRKSESQPYRKIAL